MAMNIFLVASNVMSTSEMKQTTGLPEKISEIEKETSRIKKKQSC